MKMNFFICCLFFTFLLFYFFTFLQTVYLSDGFIDFYLEHDVLTLFGLTAGSLEELNGLGEVLFDDNAIQVIERQPVERLVVG